MLDVGREKRVTYHAIPARCIFEKKIIIPSGRNFKNSEFRMICLEQMLNYRSIRILIVLYLNYSAGQMT